MVFGLVGCNSTGGFGILNIEVSHKSSIWDTVIVEDYEDVKDCRDSLSGPCSGKAEAMSIVTGEKFHIGNLPDSEARTVWTAKKYCEEVFNSKCVISRINQKVFYRNLDDYKKEEENKLAKARAAKKMEEEKLAIEKKRRKANQNYCKNAFESNAVLKLNCLDKVNWGNLSGEEAEEAVLQASLREKQKKEKILTDLTKRCEEYGFSGESNISACIQREAQHDKELAIQKLELQKTKKALQQSQSRTYAQNVTEPVEEEEDIPFLIKFLGDVVLGVAEQYPAAKLEAQKRQEAYNRGVRRGEENQRARCNNQQGNC